MMGTLKIQRRLLALWFPRLPTDRLKRHKPQVFGALPLVIVEKTKNALRLSAVDHLAEKLGLHIGQPLANARAMVSELDVVPVNHQADAALLAQLADWCDRFTPVVSLDPPDGLFLDIAGTNYLFGDEKNILGKVLHALRSNNLAVQGAIASTALSARALARYCDGCIVEEKGVAKAISPLPIEALQLDPVTTHAFRRAGLKTIGLATGRKRSEIISRFGAATLAVMDEALGQSSRPITPRRPPPDYWQAKNFAEPVVTLDVIHIALQSLATRLAAVMEREGVGARRLEAGFFRVDGAKRRIAIETGGPLRNVAVIGRLFREKLDALADPLDPGFGFDLIRLAAVRVESMEAGVVSLEATMREQAEISSLIDRLAVRFGHERVSRVYPQGTHVPEAAWSAAPAQGSYRTQAEWKAVRTQHESPRRPLRLFARPEPIEANEVPLRFLWRKASHVIAHWQGPERIAMEWWRYEKLQAARDYYRAEDETGHRYWIYRDLSMVPPKWFLHGVFA
jgi:protein ImuB